MNYTLCFLFFLFCSNLSLTQEQFEWVKGVDYKIDSLSKWKADGLGNVYVFKNNVINKYDSLGVFKFSESQKNVGSIKDVLPVNAMKVLLFSEEQQMICSSDNTLTNYSGCIDLSSLDIEYATMVSSSSQPDKFWVFDQINYDLVLYSLLGTQSQKITNIKRTIGFNSIEYLKEHENKLFIYDKTIGLYLFDIYGSVINFYPILGATSIAVSNNLVLFQFENSMLIWDFKTNKELTLPLPIVGVKEIQKQEDVYYLQLKNKIYKYRLVLN